jgi:hypothetical protein
MTDAMDNEQLTTEVAKELREGQVVFLVGAGISTERHGNLGFPCGESLSLHSSE